MEHFVLVMVEELGEISRLRKEHYRDKQGLGVDELAHELMDVFVYCMETRMGLGINLEKECLKKLIQRRTIRSERQYPTKFLGFLCSCGNTQRLLSRSFDFSLALWSGSRIPLSHIDADKPSSPSACSPQPKSRHPQSLRHDLSSSASSDLKRQSRVCL